MFDARLHLRDFLTEDEIRRAQEIYKRDQPNFHKRVLMEIINPATERIEDTLGPDVDMEWLALRIARHVGMLGPYP